MLRKPWIHSIGQELHYSSYMVCEMRSVIILSHIRRHRPCVCAQIWELTFGRLFLLPATIFIHEIWPWESVHHGDAAVINTAKTSAVCQFVLQIFRHKLWILFVSPVKPMGLMAEVTSPISSCISYHLSQLTNCFLFIYNESQLKRRHYVYKEDSRIARSWLQVIPTVDVSRKASNSFFYWLNDLIYVSLLVPWQPHFILNCFIPWS